MLWSPLDYRLGDQLAEHGVGTAADLEPFGAALFDVLRHELPAIAWRPPTVHREPRPYLLVDAESSLDTTSGGLLLLEAWGRRAGAVPEPHWRAAWTDGPLVRLDVVLLAGGVLHSARAEIRHRPA